MNKTKAVAVLILATLMMAFVPLVPVKALVAAAEPIVTIDGSSFNAMIFAASLTHMSLSPTSVLACICFYTAISRIAIIAVRRRLRTLGAPGPPGFFVWSAGSVKVLNFNEVVQKIRNMMLNTDNNNLKLFSLRVMTNSLIT